MVSVAHDTDASTGTSADTGKSYNTCKQSSQHDKCNGVIDGTISIIGLETGYYNIWTKVDMPLKFHI